MLKKQEIKSPEEQYIEELIYLGRAWGISPEIVSQCVNSVYKPNNIKQNGGN